MLNKYTIILKYGFLSALIAVPFFVSAAWLAPTQVPPNANTEGPLNTGSSLQIKNGDLSVNAFSALLDSFFADKLGVGTTPSLFTTLDINPVVTLVTSLLNIRSGITYNGSSVMTNYYGTYIATPEGSGTITNIYALVTEAGAGKVGFGTIAPASQLSVAGGIRVGDDTASCTSSKAGTIRWHNNIMELCSGVAWISVSSAAGCPATGGCPVGASSASCTTYNTSSVNTPSVCPVPRTSICSEGLWSPAPYGYATCGVLGCTNPSADNYAPLATIDNGSCYITGCTDSSACDYNPNANVYNGCIYRDDSCNSGPNNCGAVNSGTIQSDCTCSAIKPDDEQECPSE